MKYLLKYVMLSVVFFMDDFKWIELKNWDTPYLYFLAITDGQRVTARDYNWRV